LNDEEIEAARDQWIAERRNYAAYGSFLEEHLISLVRGLGIYAEVSSRAKDVHSLVKKLLAKRHHTYDTIPDKVGVRVAVRYRSELRVVEDAIKKDFGFSGADDKALALGDNMLGYQCIHIDGLCFKGNNDAGGKYPATTFKAELQLRTLAQHLWADMSHDTFYKNDTSIAQLPEDLRRRVHLMAGLLEVADREFDAMNREMPVQPEGRLLRELEKLYYRLSVQKPDIDLSLDVIRLLMPLYRGESESEIMGSHVIPRFNSSETLLRHIYSNEDGDYDNASAFLFQPEALLIYDCLKTDPDATLSVWNRRYPIKELERVATAFGLSLG
jgi:ppGpp synthetase/RelA/SpoT-type nucleotidyltranferase